MCSVFVVYMESLVVCARVGTHFEVVKLGFSFDGFGLGGGLFPDAGWPRSTPVQYMDGILSLFFRLLEDVLGAMSTSMSLS